MSARRWYVMKHHNGGWAVRQAGAGSRTPWKAERLRQQLRAIQPHGSSTWFTIVEGRK